MGNKMLRILVHAIPTEERPTQHLLVHSSAISANIPPPIATAILGSCLELLMLSYFSRISETRLQEMQ